MKHIMNKGSNKHLIITLHGTGGSATDLFDLASIIDPLATKVGFQGQVSENGMARYFARYPDGSFDIESLVRATYDLHDSILKLIKAENFQDYMITVLGYSNGANIAKNLLKEFENVKVDNMLLFHPSLITPKIGYKNQDNLNVLITSGINDPYINSEQFNDLKAKLISANMKVEAYTHNQGHQLIHDEVIFAKNFLLKLEGEAKNEQV
ncbi:MAG: carboxylesterase [Erysipelothrix sp.]|nr:carboxylesterase [Erysipelothrix sp.]